MYNAYLIDTDNATDKIYFQVDPIISPKPEVTREVKKYTSVLSFNYDGTKRNPVTHIIDAGVPSGSGVLTVNFKHLSKINFDKIWAKITANPPVLQNFYDYRTSTLYSSIIPKFSNTFEYVEGVADYVNEEVTEQRVVDGTLTIDLPNSPALPT